MSDHGDILTDQDECSQADAATSIQRSLRAISVGSFLFQRRIIEQLGLHATDLHAIHLLGRARDGLTAGELGAGLGLTSGSTTALIERLGEKGYAERSRDADDGRRVIVRLAPTAAAALREEYRSVDERVSAAIATMSQHDRRVVARFLVAIAYDRHHP